MSFSRRFAVWSLVCGVILAGSTVWAQEGADEVADPSAPAQQQPKEKMPFSLYVSATAGVVTADTIDTSLQTLVTHTANGFLDLEDAQLSRVGLGWKLPNGKGDFRVHVQNFKEDGYHFTGQGQQFSVQPVPGDFPAFAAESDPAIWWNIDITDGELNGLLTPPTWDDLNGDERIQNGNPGSEDEVFYDPDDMVVTTRNITDDLENRTQTIDLLYGREFGRRVISSRWWAGLRYFTYNGNIPAVGWLSSFPDGSGFTDGNLLRMLNYTQDSSGFGPTGSMSIDVNLLSERLTFYLEGTAAFTVLSINADTGEFVTLVRASSPTEEVAVPARLSDSRNKSTWQNAAEAGVRLKLKNGIGLELSYSVTGYLDVILAPTEIRIPATEQEAPQGSSALYNTQDLVFDGWRAGFSFQF